MFYKHTFQVLMCKYFMNFSGIYFSMFWEKSADYKMIFFFKFSHKVGLDISCRNRSHDMSSPAFWEKIRNMFLNVICSFLRGFHTLHGFSTIFSKGDYFGDFLCAFLYTKSLLKRDLL